MIWESILSSRKAAMRDAEYSRWSREELKNSCAAVMWEQVLPEGFCSKLEYVELVLEASWFVWQEL
jgi:hypothetical protein